jgi:hypothetical protein
MGMNPDTNRLEELGINEEALRNTLQDSERRGLERQLQQLKNESALVRPDGTPVPKHWSVFTVGEHVVVKNYTFRVAYFNETTIVLEPVGPVVLGTENGG